MCDVVERRKPLHDGWRDVPHRHDVAKHEVAQDGSTHHPRPFVHAAQTERHQHGGPLRERQRDVLVVPARHHPGDVRAEEPAERNVADELVAQSDEGLEATE